MSDRSKGTYQPFDQVTNAALQHALAESNLSLNLRERESLMKAYDNLSTFPEIESTLKALQKESDIDAYVFSNGTDTMVGNSVNKSPSLSPLSSVFKDFVTVEEVKTYKPSPKVYEYLARKVGKEINKEDMANIWLVSGNPFDVVGARAVGLNAAWVDRAGGHSGAGGWNDRLGTIAGDGPTVIVKGVDEAVDEIKKWAAANSSS